MKLILFVSAALVGGGLTAHALEGLPKRKPGLWEIRNEMQGRPIPTGPIQTCVDEKTDDLMQQQADQTKHKCKPVNWKKDGDKITIESECNIMEKTNAKATAVFTGDLNSNYRGDVHMTYDPPIHGRSEMNMTLYAKWIGPCREGQKAGDVDLPEMNGKTMPNVQELIKMREQLKSMQNK